MNPIDIINKYYPEENELRHILLTHSRSVADKSLWIADRHPELSLDKDFLYEAAMLSRYRHFSLQMRQVSIVLATSLISVTVIWEPTWYAAKAIPAMLWFVNAIRVPDFHWRESLRRICPYRIVKWFRSAWKNKLSVFADKFYSKNSFGKRRKV